MKKFFLILAMSVCAFSMIAQTTVTNNSFENWSSAGLTQEQPDGWTAGLIGNVLVELGDFQLPVPVDTYFGSKSTDSHSGNYALKLKSNTVGITGTSYSFQFPGIAQLGSATGFNIPLSAITNIAEIIGSISSGDTSGIDWNNIDLESLSSLSQALAPGDAVSQTPGHVNMWVKFHPEDGDNLYIIAFSKMGGSIVGMADYSTAETLDNYTLISVPFENALEPCDSLCIIIAAGSTSSSDNTELLLDDITLDFIPEGVAARDIPTFEIYPNPTAGQFFVKPVNEEPYNYELLDLQGRLVDGKMNCQGVVNINTQNVAKGVYVLKTTQNTQTRTQKVVVR